MKLRGPMARPPRDAARSLALPLLSLLPLAALACEAPEDAVEYPGSPEDPWEDDPAGPHEISEEIE